MDFVNCAASSGRAFLKAFVSRREAVTVLYVTFQHRPFFLRTPIGGQMSYDVYISGLNVAIEYQGKQHFNPVDFFGGYTAFQNVQRRDKLKADLSRAHGVKLVYVNYWEDITPALIVERVGIQP